jgi:hypothetical protein
MQSSDLRLRSFDSAAHLCNSNFSHF